MSETVLKKQGGDTTSTMMKVMVIGLGLATGACVNVAAPDKPIVINLNISVTQEVVYRLDNEAKSLIKQNPGIF
ncbi:YnbE family lipoprotein [Sphingomonas radiodurans]|uniref:YnbE family lipoprotein n=1 Tax=Sphingomonas radiodurans TaxID=2890321 RepID=UPI001E397609|nr:YnbE family lipoprotein [Sphingomonas radiodurans]WBH15500.1 YnbE family lipoprotein [Sphingomonas radiodurans]